MPKILIIIIVIVIILILLYVMNTTIKQNKIIEHLTSDISNNLHTDNNSDVSDNNNSINDNNSDISDNNSDNSNISDISDISDNNDNNSDMSSNITDNKTNTDISSSVNSLNNITTKQPTQTTQTIQQPKQLTNLTPSVNSSDTTDKCADTGFTNLKTPYDALVNLSTSLYRNDIELNTIRGRNINVENTVNAKMFKGDFSGNNIAGINLSGNRLNLTGDLTVGTINSGNIETKTLSVNENIKAKNINLQDNSRLSFGPNSTLDLKNSTLDLTGTKVSGFTIPTDFQKLSAQNLELTGSSTLKTKFINSITDNDDITMKAKNINIVSPIKINSTLDANSDVQINGKFKVNNDLIVNKIVSSNYELMNDASGVVPKGFNFKGSLYSNGMYVNDPTGADLYGINNVDWLYVKKSNNIVVGLNNTNGLYIKEKDKEKDTFNTTSYFDNTGFKINNLTRFDNEKGLMWESKNATGGDLNVPVMPTFMLELQYEWFNYANDKASFESRKTEYESYFKKDKLDLTKEFGVAERKWSAASLFDIPSSKASVWRRSLYFYNARGNPMALYNIFNESFIQTTNPGQVNTVKTIKNLLKNGVKKIMVYLHAAIILPSGSIMSINPSFMILEVKTDTDGKQRVTLFASIDDGAHNKFDSKEYWGNTVAQKIAALSGANEEDFRYKILNAPSYYRINEIGQKTSIGVALQALKLDDFIKPNLQ